MFAHWTLRNPLGVADLSQHGTISMYSTEMRIFLYCVSRQAEGKYSLHLLKC